jgi:hypothetical protein
MVSSNGTLTPLESKLELANYLLSTIDLAVENGDEDLAVRLVGELAVYLVSIDKKCVAKGL